MITASTQTPVLTLLHPESCLTLGGISLIEMLNTGTVKSISQRTSMVNG